MNRVKMLLVVGLAVVAFAGIGCNGDNSSGVNHTPNNPPNPASNIWSVDWSEATEGGSSLNKKSVQNDGSAPAQTIKGTKWKLVGVEGMRGLLELEPKDCEHCYTLTFGEDNTFTGFSAVNSLFGVYTVNSNEQTIKIVEFGGTKVGSISEDNDLFERPFWEKQIHSVNITGNELRLFYLTDGDLLFRLVE